METTHTKGPWIIKDSKIISLNSWLVSPSDGEEGIPTTVVDLHGAMGGDDSRADAKLIAAAPELLRLLKETIDISIWYFDNELNKPYSKELLEAIELVKQIES